MATTEHPTGAGGVRPWEEVAPTYRQSWERQYGSSGRGWDEVEPGYRYSYEMARDPRYRGRAWSEIEANLGADYAGWARLRGYRAEQHGWDRVREDVRMAWEAERVSDETPTMTEGERTLELREEELIPHKEMREVGEVVIRTEIEEVPGRLEVEAFREEVEVEHVPVGQVVSERVQPWQEEDTLFVPVYEEQLVMVKRLVLREHLKIRRVRVAEKQLFEDMLRRERVVVEDPTNTGLVHEKYPDDREIPGA